MKKLHLSILYVVLLSLLLGSTILLSKPVDKSRSKAIDNVKTDNREFNTAAVYNNEESANAYKNDISKRECIAVFDNNSDIDLQANLTEDKSGQVSLQLEYRINGKHITKIIDTSA